MKKSEMTCATCIYGEPAGNFGATAGGFNSAPIATAGLGAAAAMAVPFVSNEVLTGPGGKPMPVQPPDPEI